MTYSKADSSSSAFNDSVAVLRANNLQGRAFDLVNLVHVPRTAVSGRQLIKRGDVVVATSSGSISVVGKAVQAESDMEVGFGAFCGLLRPHAEVGSRYFGHFFSSGEYRKRVSEMARGVNINNLKREHFASLTLPLAPLAEQKRIADKLDALLARVDACRERLDRVPTILKRFRQSVLMAATSGCLTEEWRNVAGANLVPWKKTLAQGKPSLPDGYRRLSKQTFRPVRISHEAVALPASWAVCTIGDLYNENALLDFADGNHGSLYPRKEEFGDTGVRFLTAGQIGDQWELEIEECPRLNQNKARKLVKGWARNGDVLLTHNATVGRVAYFDFDEEVLLGTSVTFFRFNPQFIAPKFARIVFSSPFFQRQLESAMEQTTRNQVPITKQVSLNFVCPPIEEQAEIVRRVEALFALTDRLEQRYKTARAQVDKLTPALLAKAFRGELVPQNPNDEPASVLLDRIRAERAAAGPNKPTRGRKARERA